MDEWIWKWGKLTTKRKIVLFATFPLLIGLLALLAWLMTEPEHDAGSLGAKECSEYVKELEMLNRYKLFWTFIQRRVAYNDCMERVGQRGNQQKEDRPVTN